MRPLIMVIAKSDSVLNKFGQESLREAVNTKDFLEQTGEYTEVSIFQLLSTDGLMTEWVKLKEIEC